MGLKRLVQEMFDLPTDDEKKRQSRILSYRTEGKLGDDRYVVTASGRTIFFGTPEYEEYLKTNGKNQ